jgi:hypothetical protein
VDEVEKLRESSDDEHESGIAGRDASSPAREANGRTGGDSLEVVVVELPLERGPLVLSEPADDVRVKRKGDCGMSGGVSDPSSSARRWRARLLHITSQQTRHVLGEELSDEPLPVLDQEGLPVRLPGNHVAKAVALDLLQHVVQLGREEILEDGAAFDGCCVVHVNRRQISAQLMANGRVYVSVCT